jgi:hypothetical protein
LTNADGARALQKPHPPIWYGPAPTARRRRRAGACGWSASTAGRTCIAFDSFRVAWRDARPAPLPLMGLDALSGRMMQALAIARRAYPRWRASFTHLRRA